MNIKIEINCDNAAFESFAEVSRILIELADRAEGLVVCQLPELDGLPLTDYNGNRVGTVTVTED